MISNKRILTEFNFPSVYFMMWVQSLFTILISLPRLQVKKSGKDLNTLFTTCGLNIGNIFFGLSASGLLNIAMFTALRRISIAMTMIGQWVIFNKNPKLLITISVLTTILGSFTAAFNDITYNRTGYFLIMGNNILTTGAQISQKRSLNAGWTKYEIIFYTSLSMFVATTIKNYSSIEEITKFKEWSNPEFLFFFTSSLTLGYIINMSYSWVIEKNGSLTLAMAGSFKNIILSLIVCMGFIDPTYKYSIYNFIGLQISGIASLIYIYNSRNE